MVPLSAPVVPPSEPAVPLSAPAVPPSAPATSLDELAVVASLPFTTSHAEWIGLVIGLISLAGIGGILSTFICHRKGCWRRGRFPHGHYRLCHVHHPLVPSDGNITDEHIHAVTRQLAAAGHQHAGPEHADSGPAGP